MRTVLLGTIRQAASPNVGFPTRTVIHNPSPVIALGTAPRPINQNIAQRAVDYFGDGFIAGLVTVEEVPARRLVRLLDAKTSHVVASVFSGLDGRYRFDQLNRERLYIVLANDYTQQFNAVVADSVRAVLAT
jgi:hypothetical protein